VRLGNEVAGSEAAAAEASTATATATTLTSLLSLATLLALSALLALSTLLTLSTLLALTALLALTSLLAVVTAVVATVVAAAVTTNSEPDAVVLGATLGNGHDHGSVVGRGAQGASTVDTVGETGCKIGAERTLAVSVVVDSLEEGKVHGIQSVGRVLVATHVLNSDMGVTNDATALELLRCGVVGVVGVGERTSLQVVDLDRELDGLVRLDVVTILGARENGGDHLVGGRNFSHDCSRLGYRKQRGIHRRLTDTVARSLLDLQTVGKSLALTEVDEVGCVTGEC
jgi:hypothetical protein